MTKPQRVIAAGHPLICQVCKGGTFEHRTMTLTTSGIANSGFNKRAELAVCTTCGHVTTFLAGSPLTWVPQDGP